MAETLATLRAALLARGLDGLDEGPARQAVNIGIQRVCRAACWPFLEAATEGIVPFVIADVHRIKMVRIPGRGNVQLPFKRHEALSDGTDTGTASAFGFEHGQTLTTYPYEDGLHLTVDYWKRHPALTGDDDVCLIPDAYASVILDAACIEASKQLREWESIQGFKQEYLEGVAEMVDELLDPQAVNTDFIELPVY